MSTVFLSCGPPEKDRKPTAYPNSVTLPRQGGSRDVQICTEDGKPYKRSWFFYNVTVPTQGRFGTLYEEDDEALKVDTLQDGTWKAYGEWYTFHVTNDCRSIRVSAVANQTGFFRSVCFTAQEGFRIYLYQLP